LRFTPLPEQISNLPTAPSSSRTEERPIPDRLNDEASFVTGAESVVDGGYMAA
jgi:hypothetical protein